MFDTDVISPLAGPRSGNDGERPRVAIIGSGIAGLSAAYGLQHSFDITVFEQNDSIGGHTNTVWVDEGDKKVPVDTGFIVFNSRNYPNLTALFDRLDVASNETTMHFSVSARPGGLEYSSRGFSGLFADKKNLASPKFLAMVADILRFYRAAPDVASTTPDLTIGEFLAAGRYGKSFIRDHLMPMAAAIWSCPADTMLEFPAASLARFFVNHGLVELATPIKWRSVDGGSQSYIAPLTAGFADRIRTNSPVSAVTRTDAGIEVHSENGVEHFDEVVFACHGPQARRLLVDADREEFAILSAFETEPNTAVLHTDPALMPRRRQAWASWNYLRNDNDNQNLSVTYWMNALQKIDTDTNYFVTLNPAVEPAADRVVKELRYDHPVFDGDAMRAQKDIWSIQGRRRAWFCGAYLGYGFHEDGVQSGLAVAESMSDWRRPWAFDYSSERLARSVTAPPPLRERIAA
ncbi:MAG: FAD-dependent oxidoreductase [Pseudomonadota bacterium]